MEYVDHQDRQDKDAGFTPLLWLFVLVQPGLRIL
jgi:hypothetical protein